MTASLGELAGVVEGIRLQRTPKALRGLRPELLRRSYRELRALPELRVHVDDCRQGSSVGCRQRLLIRAELGIGMIRFAMELPASFEDFLASHNRANNLRKSMRRAVRAGISFAVVEGERERTEAFNAVATGWAGQLPDGIGPDIGTLLVALDLEGRPLATAVLLRSGSTAQLALLVVDRGCGSRSMVRYALNAFAIRVAIESGARVLLLTGAVFSTPPGIRVLAINCGYRARRILLDWDIRNPHDWAALALNALVPPARASKRDQPPAKQH